MIKILLSLALFLLLAVACSKKKSDQQQDACERFALHLKAGMDYPAIVNTFGAPEKDLGSGVHIYVYPLEDGTAVWIGYNSNIMYARHMDNNRQLLHNII